MVFLGVVISVLAGCVAVALAVGQVVIRFLID